MMAGIVAARRGSAVTVIERLNRVGKKLLATGNGRCNLTNTNLSIERYHGENPQFAFDALDQFNTRRTIAFFEELGIELFKGLEICVQGRGKIGQLQGTADFYLHRIVPLWRVNVF